MSVTSTTNLAGFLNEADKEGLIVTADSVERRARSLGVFSRLVPTTIGGGDKVRWSVQNGAMVATSMATQGAEYAASQSTSYDDAALDWSMIHVPFTIEEHVIDILNSGAANLANGLGIIQTLVDDAERAMALKVETMALASSKAVTTDIDCLGTVIAATGNYADISHTQSYWQSHIDAASAAWSVAKMQAFLETYRSSTFNGTGTVALVSYPQFHKIENVLKTNNPVQYVSTTEVVAGATGIRYENVTILPVTGIPDARFYLVDPADWDFVELPIVNGRFEMLAKTGPAIKMVLRRKLALRCRNPKNQAAMTALL